MNNPTKTPHKNRIIVQNDSKLPTESALFAVAQIIKKGRVAAFGRQYAHATHINTLVGPVVIACDINKGSDRFVVQDGVSA